MNLLVTYDVNTETKDGQRRLYRVARLCKDYGLRVQNSVFECVVSEVQLIELKNKLEKVINMEKDNIRIYYLNKKDTKRVISIGRDSSIDIEGILMV